MTSRPNIGRSAQADLRDAFRWYENQTPGLGREFTRAIRVTLSRVHRNPLHFPLIWEDVRKATVPRFPYSVYFVLLQNVPTVIAVIHSSRDPKTWMQRR